MDKKKKCKIDTYPVDLYGVDVIVVQNPSFSMLSKRYNIEEEDISQKADATTVSGLYNLKTRRPVVMIVMKRWNDKYDLVNTCAHEALHAATDILIYRGITLNHDTSEAYTYLAGWLTECVYKSVTKK